MLLGMFIFTPQQREDVVKNLGDVLAEAQLARLIELLETSYGLGSDLEDVIEGISENRLPETIDNIERLQVGLSDLHRELVRLRNLVTG